MKEEGIDIVQNHFLHADILGTLAAKMARVPVILTTRRDEGFWRSKRQLSINRWLNQFVAKILVNSLAVKEAVSRSERISSKRIHMVHNGVDLAKYQSSDQTGVDVRKELGIKDGECVVGEIANMRYRVKGHRYLIRAIPLIQQVIQH